MLPRSGLLSRLGMRSFGLPKDPECESADDLSNDCLSMEPNAGLSIEPNGDLSNEPRGANFLSTGRGFFPKEPPIGASGA